MKEVVLDTETTGISVKEGHRIVEIGCIELDNLVAVVDFDFTANGCPTPETLQFTLTDLSTELSPDYTQLSSDWTIVSSEGTNTFTGPTVTNTLDPFQLISVTLEVVFDNNCTATITKEINLEDSLPESDFEVELIGCLENGLASFTLSDISNIIPGNSSNPTDWDWTIISADGSIINSDLQVVELEIDPNQVIDVSLLVNFENGCVANLTASRISLKNMRKTRFFQKDAYISVDFLEKKCEVVKMKDAPELPGDFDMVLQNAEGVKKQIYFDNPSISNNNAILDELETFADAINNNTKPIVTLHDGTEALRVATQIINCFK